MGSEDAAMAKSVKEVRGPCAVLACCALSLPDAGGRQAPSPGNMHDAHSCCNPQHPNMDTYPLYGKGVRGVRGERGPALTLQP